MQSLTQLTDIVQVEPLPLAPALTSDRVGRVVVICHLGRTGYNIQRALHAIGVRSYLVYDKRAASVRWSRGCTPLHRADDLALADPAVIAAKINALHAEVGIDSVIPADVHSSMLLANMRHLLVPPTFPIADAETLRMLDNKWTFATTCMRHNVPIPKTLYFADNGAVDSDLIGQRLGYPVVVKPVVGFGQRNMLILHNVDEVAQFQQASSHPQGMVVQEYVSGQDWSLSVLARDGVVTHWTAWECPHQLGRSYGVARFLTTTFRGHEALVEMGRQIVAATGFSGVANFDARLRPDGQMVLFECNPRFFNRMLAARMCGLNFVAAGLPQHTMKQPADLTVGDYYPWQELFTMRGLKLLLSGKWQLQHLVRDLTEMLSDPLPPLIRKVTREDEMAAQ